MNKKLALVLYKYFPYGGLQKDFMEIAKELLSRGNSLKVYTRSWEGEIPDDLEIIQLGETGISNYSKNKKFIKKAFKALEDFEPDIIFGFNKMPGLDLYFAADSCFAFQSQSKPFLQRYTRRFRQSIKYEEEVFSRDVSTKTLLLNNKQLNEFSKFYSTPSNRMTLVPPGIDRDWSTYKPINIRERLSIPPEDKVLLFVGSDFSRKGLDRAILALSYLLKKKKSATLIVIGDDDQAPYKKLLQHESLDKKVSFIGPSQEVASFMKSADLLIHPAREEAAGNIIIEAIVSGLPSVVTESVGFSSEVLKYQSGEVLKGDFNQDNFNLLVADTLADEKLSAIKESIHNLSDCDYFFSRFKYIADYIENEF